MGQPITDLVLWLGLTQTRARYVMVKWWCRNPKIQFRCETHFGLTFTMSYTDETERSRCLFSLRWRFIEGILPRLTDSSLALHDMTFKQPWCNINVPYRNKWWFRDIFCEHCWFNFNTIWVCKTECTESMYLGLYLYTNIPEALVCKLSQPPIYKRYVDLNECTWLMAFVFVATHIAHTLPHMRMHD